MKFTFRITRDNLGDFVLAIYLGLILLSSLAFMFGVWFDV